MYCISIREEGNSLPEGTATATQQSRLSQGDRQQKGSCCFRFTSPGLWLGIAWHKRRGSRLSLWRPQKLSQMFVRSGEIPSPGQTSSDKNNDCAMKSERGTPDRGSDPPSGHSVYKTTGDSWRAPARHLTQTYLGAAVYGRNQATKILDPSPMAKNRRFFRFERRALDAAGNFSPPRPRIHLVSSRPSSTFTGLARHEAGWPWVASMSRSKDYRRVSCF